jgi:hypothetical protein
MLNNTPEQNSILNMSIKYTNDRDFYNTKEMKYFKHIEKYKKKLSSSNIHFYMEETDLLHLKNIKEDNMLLKITYDNTNINKIIESPKKNNIELIINKKKYNIHYTINTLKHYSLFILCKNDQIYYCNGSFDNYINSDSLLKDNYDIHTINYKNTTYDIIYTGEFKNFNLPIYISLNKEFTIETFLINFKYIIDYNYI